MRQDRLNQAIVEAGYRKGWFAHRLGVSQTQLSHFLSGHNRMPPEKRARAAEILGLSEADLFGEPDSQVEVRASV